jgi:hypothetical protein
MNHCGQQCVRLITHDLHHPIITECAVLLAQAGATRPMHGHHHIEQVLSLHHNKRFAWQAIIAIPELVCQLHALSGSHHPSLSCLSQQQQRSTRKFYDTKLLRAKKL